MMMRRLLLMQILLLQKLVTAYEDAKSAITSPDTETEGTKAAKSYIDAKAALEKILNHLRRKHNLKKQKLVWKKC